MTSPRILNQLLNRLPQQALESGPLTPRRLLRVAAAYRELAAGTRDGWGDEWFTHALRSLGGSSFYDAEWGDMWRTECEPDPEAVARQCDDAAAEWEQAALLMGRQWFGLEWVETAQTRQEGR